MKPNRLWLRLAVFEVVVSSLSAQPQNRTGLVQLTDRAWGWVAKNDRSSNSALFIGDDSALIVDPGLTPSTAQEFLTSVGEVSDIPIRWVVLTHWHPDHSLGTVCRSLEGVQLIAHPENRRAIKTNLPGVLKQFAEAAASDEERAELQQCVGKLPELLVEKQLTIDLGAHAIEVFHPGTAHTQGDLVVWSQDERILVTGDLFLNNSAPFMGEGNTVTWVDALESLARRKPAHIIPGHFAVATLTDMMRFKEYLQTQIDQAKTALGKGLTVEQAVEASEFSEFQSFLQYPQYAATFADNARVVYHELVQAQNETKNMMEEKLRKEILELHQFFEDWFTGQLQNTDGDFSRFADVLADDFQIISPSGRRTERAALMQGLRNAHANRANAEKPFRIWIENIRIRAVAKGRYLVTYEEWQEADGERKGRLSSALFREKAGAPNEVEWMHVHETWLP